MDGVNNHLLVTKFSKPSISRKLRAWSTTRLEKKERDKIAEDMEAINKSRKFEQEKRDREKAEAKAEEKGLELDIPEQKPGGPKQVYFIVKSDVSGSVEAVIDSIAALGTKEVQPQILRSGVG
jgi:translation initiation factor IF-2